MTDADSPPGVRRRIHLRSLSDVTPASCATTPRARSHSERPRVLPSPSPSPSHTLAPRPERAVVSARTSPAVSRERLDFAAPLAPATGPSTPRLRHRTQTVTVLGDPWRKMNDPDLGGATTRSRPAAGQASLDATRGFDPWVKKPALRPAADFGHERIAPNDDTIRAGSDAETKRDGTFRRGKLERKAAVVCESCGNESCECWRPRSPSAPRTPRVMRSLGTLATASSTSAATRCTCNPLNPSTSPRPSPSRLLPRVPVRALSDDESHPRRLYKSASQKMICTTIETECVTKTGDPLLETTC